MTETSLRNWLMWSVAINLICKSQEKCALFMKYTITTVNCRRQECSGCRSKCWYHSKTCCHNFLCIRDFLFILSFGRSFVRLLARSLARSLNRSFIFLFVHSFDRKSPLQPFFGMSHNDALGGGGGGGSVVA